MTENYVELLIRKQPSPIAKAIRFACIVMCVVQIAIGTMSGSWFFFITGLLFLGVAYLVAYFFNLEYEYLYLDKQLSIDAIHNQSKRKKVAEYNLPTDMEVLAPVASHHLDSMKAKVSKVKDYTTGKADANVYGLIVHVEKELHLVKIEMNDELYKQISMVSPRKVFKD